MLVLSRRKNERIMIGDDIVITVTEIRSDKVRLGITAPDGVEIWREEIRPANEPQTSGGGRTGDDLPEPLDQPAVPVGAAKTPAAEARSNPFPAE